MPDHYGLNKVVAMSYEAAIESAAAALKTQGFGVLTTIDVKATLKKKLGVETRPYVILGACNPPLAHQALQTEPEIGLLLPCNVIVYDNEDGTSTISAIDPGQMMRFAGNPALEPLAAEASERIQKALAALG